LVYSGASGVPEHLQPEVLRDNHRRFWIERALAPVIERLDETTRQKLIAALVVHLGAEAVVRLRNLAGLTPEETVSVTRWAVTALVHHALADIAAARAANSALAR
jgi:hypothetical protein